MTTLAVVSRRKDAMNLWVVIAAYNESTVIAETLRGLAPFAFKTVVVDDGSTDGTGAAARQSGAYVIRHIVNLGQGAALQTGIDFALAAGATHICTFDADGQHAPASILALVEAMQRSNADVALASRFVESSPMPKARRLLLLAARSFTRVQTGLRFTDVHNGLRLFTKEAAWKLRIRQPRMAHASEILCSIAKHRLTFVEVAAATAYTTYSVGKGQTTLSSIEILFDLLYAAWSR